MKILNKDGEIIKSKMGKGTKAVKTHLLVLHKLATEKSIEAIETDNGELVRLQEVKDYLKELKGNPFNMVLETGHANAKVRHWYLRLVIRGLPIEVNGKLEVQRLDALEFGDAVVYANFQAMRHRINAEKDQKIKKKMQGRMETFMALPRRDSYYK